VAHFFGDILFNPDRLAKSKRAENLGERLRGLGMHCVVHAAFVWVFLMPFENSLRIKAVIYVFFVHFFIDLLRTSLETTFFDQEIPFTVSKRDFYNYLMRKETKLKGFMGRHGKPWVIINVTDQFLHFFYFAGFVTAVGKW
jgi:hypothetical protein